MSDVNDLVAFLRARLDEDEQVAKAAIQGPWQVGTMAEHLNDRVIYGASPVSPGRIAQVCDLTTAWHRTEGGAHIVRHDPARVLAEVEAKRQIVNLHSDGTTTCPTCRGVEYIEVRWDGDTETVERPQGPAEAPCQTLRLLALPHAAHPDYRPEWRP